MTMQRAGLFRHSLLLLLVASSFAAAGSVPAIDYVVDDPGDRHDLLPGDGICGDPEGCTLRAAVEEAAADAASSALITFAPDITTIRLSLGTITLGDKRWTIRGSASLVTLDGVDNPWREPTITILSSPSAQLEGLRLRRSRGDGLVIGSFASALVGTGSWGGRVSIIESGLDQEDAAGIRCGEYAGLIARGLSVGVEFDSPIPRGNGYGIVCDGQATFSLGAENDSLKSCISGNRLDGILTSARFGSIVGALIGLDATGYISVPNGRNGISLEQSQNTEITGCRIAGNLGHGILAVGDSCSFSVSRCVIGLNASGIEAAPNLGYGVLVADGVQSELLGTQGEENTTIISGNARGGVAIVGTAHAIQLVNCWIGFDESGFSGIGNGTGPGILITGGSRNNQVGLAIDYGGCAIGGHASAGIIIEESSTGNRVQNCLVGTNAYGTSSVSNGTGIILQSGAAGNVIGGTTFIEANLLSGNRADQFPFGAGLLITDQGTDGNHVLGNYIGLDASGTRALRNSSAGVVISGGASSNTIGGCEPGEGNIISGNGSTTNVASLGRGIHIYGPSTDNTTISGNWIGYSADGLTFLPNRGHGIAVVNGAGGTLLGNPDNSCMNEIAANDGFGCYFDAIDNARLLHHHWVGNDSGPIGARNLPDWIAPRPVILQVTPNAISIDPENNPNDTSRVFQLYRVRKLPGSGMIDHTWIRELRDQVRDFPLPAALVEEGDSVAILNTTTPISALRGFSDLAVVSIALSADPESAELPRSYALHQNFPNPFNPSTTISFDLPVADKIDLAVYNVLGQQVADLIASQRFPAGSHMVTFEASGIASGVYWYRLTTSSGTTSRSMLLLK